VITKFTPSLLDFQILKTSRFSFDQICDIYGCFEIDSVYNEIICYAIGAEGNEKIFRRHSMKVKIFLCFLAIILMGACFLASSAVSVTKNPECVRDATDARNDCVSACQESFRIAKDACRNVKHDCAEGCRAEYDSCIQNDPTLIELATCKADCQTTLETAKALCRDNHPAGSVERDTCIDTAQLAAFVCRDDCREKYNAGPAVKACRDGFRTCVGNCEPSIP
jgi:hypothetical protein